MRRVLIVLSLVLIAATGVGVYNRSRGDAAPPSQPERGAPSAGNWGGGPGAMARPPMTVEVAAAARGAVSEQLLVVGNLIGAATVDVVPKVSGRLQDVLVRLGDPVTRGRAIARVDDREVREQVKQAEASFEVARATIRQREADLKFAESSLERARNLFGRQLLPRQALDDADARFQAASAQLDLARAQFEQARARLEELRITLSNTTVVSPVDGFVGKRYLDEGAFAGPNQPIASVVDIRFVRLVANLVEKDLKRVGTDTPAAVEVDAYPGETFEGRVARVAPVLDPSTRTAEIEVEVPNRGFRLKPGMYARVRLTIDSRSDALVVPRNAVVDIDGRRGVFVATTDTARFRPIETGFEDTTRVEITSGIAAGDPVVTTGAAALRDGDRIVRADGGAQRGGSPPAGARGPQRPQGGRS
jgi:RND family efflux transporter MFP subunit